MNKGRYYYQWFIICLLFIGFRQASAQSFRFNNLPQLNLTTSQLSKLIIPASQWNPYPELRDQTQIYTIPKPIRDAYIHKAEKLLNNKWNPLPASVFLQYQRNGNRTNYEDLSFQRRRDLACLVLGEVFEKKGRFVDQIVNGIWAICEESFWGVPAHLNLQKAGFGLPDVRDRVVDLFSAETASELAWISYLLKPQLNKVSPLILQRIVYEVNTRIFVPYLQHADWAYLGFKWRLHPDSVRRVNNWNPWINSNVLAATLLLANGGQRDQLIAKSLQSINNYIAPYPADGASDEGPEYWLHGAGALLDYLELLKSASNNKINVFNQPLIKSMGAYIYKVYIKDQYFFNYADADGRLKPDAGLLYRYGAETKNDTLKCFAAFIAKQTEYGCDTLQGAFGVLNRVLAGLHIINQLQSQPAKEPLLTDVWFPVTQIMAARSNRESARSLYLAVKGGNNGTSHNHNDVGNFIVYDNGYPVLIDAGAEDYTAQTFSGQRYQLWNNQSAYHNLPTINGEVQKAGSNFCASNVHYYKTARQASISMDLSRAYPEKAYINYWTRTVKLSRGVNITLIDKYKLNRSMRPVVENFLTVTKPDLSIPGVITLQHNKRKSVIYYNAKQLIARLEPIAIAANSVGSNGAVTRMQSVWGNTLYRITLTSLTKHLQGIISIKIN